MTKKTEEARPTGRVKRYRPVGIAAPAVAKAAAPKAEAKKAALAPKPKPKSAKK